MQVAAVLDPSNPFVVRINAEDTSWFEDDLALCRHAGVAAIMLPKAESVNNLQRVAQLGLPVLPLIETGPGEDSNCPQVLASVAPAVDQADEPTSRPPSGARGPAKRGRSQ